PPACSRARPRARGAGPGGPAQASSSKWSERGPSSQGNLIREGKLSEHGAPLVRIAPGATQRGATVRVLHGLCALDVGDSGQGWIKAPLVSTKGITVA